MRSPLTLVLTLAVATVAGCSRAPHFEFPDETQITFTNRNPMVREGLVLGPSSRARFVQTVSQPESDFDPKLLQLSAPMGAFQAGDAKFEYHLGLVAYRVGSRVHIWQSDFSRQLGDALLNRDRSWKEMLER
jgi:hypothetical protein